MAVRHLATAPTSTVVPAKAGTTVEVGLRLRRDDELRES
jgi:hypothetical protein